MNTYSTAQAVKSIKAVTACVWCCLAFLTIGSAGCHALAASLNQSLPSLTITLTGDVLLDRGVRERIEHLGADALFSPSVDSLFATSDIVVGNLECPATHIRQPNYKLFIFRGEPEWLSVLRRHGFTHFNLANNHSIDQGREGLMDTRRNLIDAQLTPFGADSTMSAAAEPLLLAKEPRPVYIVPSLRLSLENFHLLPYKPSPSQEPFDSLLNRVGNLRSEHPDAVIIVSLHWGGEHMLHPVPQQREDAHRLIDKGADLLVCHHTHTLQTIENYKGHLIYYSIGNFIFDQQRDINRRAAAVKLTVTEDSLDVQTIPIIINKCVPSIDKERFLPQH